MSVAAAMTIEPPGRPRIDKTELARLEGLGDNCEFGFVLRRQGFEDGMLFRWASIQPESLLATLRGNFEQLYEFDNLVPLQPGMVRDLHYGTAWHTQMKSARREGALVFNDDIDTRREIHSRESSKLAYLTKKLLTKFNHPNPVFVIKSNTGINEQLLEAIHYQIYRRMSSPHFLLLEVREDAARSGEVELRDRNWMRGYISRFASYNHSEEGDDASWLPILTKALAHHAATPASGITAESASAPSAVFLPFRPGRNRIFAIR